MNNDHNDRLIQFLRSNAPQAPAAPADLEQRIAQQPSAGPQMPWLGAFAAAAVLMLGVLVSLTGKHQTVTSISNQAFSAQEALVEAALGLDDAEQAENSDQISDELYGEWLSLAAVVAQN
jgi:hypothetical protein